MSRVRPTAVHVKLFNNPDGCRFANRQGNLFGVWVLTSISRTLRPDGVYLIQDIHASSQPHEYVSNPAGVFSTTMHCMTVSLAQPGGMGVGTMWGRQLAETMLRDTDFTHIEVMRLAHDFQNDYYIIRRPQPSTTSKLHAQPRQHPSNRR